ncbi:MAG: 50S ribosomal protein L17 [Brevinematales bacterium]|nr:50S ribosomal protein L17 [Brevinematales bacterium]
MRHGNRVKKLSRTTSHRRALVRNLATSLFKYERIITTVEKAKFIRPFAEKLITKAKTDTVASRRKVFETIRDEAVLNKLFVDIAKRYANRPGGYTRIIRLGYRSNDGAERAIIELVEEKLENATAKNAK